MAFDFLEAESNKGYGTLPIPNARDEQISEALRAWAVLSEFERNASLKEFRHGTYYRTLECYSERMASLAVRTGSKEFIILGLLALGVHDHLEPWGIRVSTVALHFDASERIRANTREVFEEAAELLPDQAAQDIRSYLTRPVDKRTIEVMAYHATTAGDGFRYQRDIDPLAAMRKRRSNN